MQNRDFFWDHFGTLVPFGTKSRIRDLIGTPGLSSLISSHEAEVFSPWTAKRHNDTIGKQAVHQDHLLRETVAQAHYVKENYIPEA